MKNWVFGKHVIEAVIKFQPGSIKKIYLSSNNSLRDHPEIKNFIIETWEHTKFERWLPKLPHQNAILELDFWPSYDINRLWRNAIKPGTNKLILILDKIQNTHNFGALIRTAHACGVLAIIAPQDNQARMNAKVAHVSAGTCFSTPVVFVKNISRAIAKLITLNFWIVAATQNAENSYYEGDFKDHNVAVIVGNEGEGIRPLIIKKADFVYKIPMIEIESLNVGVAAALMLYEIRNKQNFWKNN